MNEKYTIKLENAIVRSFKKRMMLMKWNEWKFFLQEIKKAGKLGGLVGYKLSSTCNESSVVASLLMHDRATSNRVSKIRTNRVEKKEL